MSPIVKCDVCGGIYNEKYVSSHRRLAHGRAKVPAFSTRNHPDALEMIVSMYAQLSDESKKEVRERLADADRQRQ